MDSIFTIHRIFGEMILPVLIVAAAIWFTASWKPDASRSPAARLFPILVDLQAGLGIILWVARLSTPAVGYYLSFPFILHPIIGLLAAGLAHMAVGRRNPLSSLGRWAPLAALMVILVMVIGNVLIVSVQA